MSFYPNKKVRRLILVVLLCFTVLFIVGCGIRPIDTVEANDGKKPTSPELDTQSVNKRRIPVLMFHNLDYSLGTWCITPENFRSDVEFMLENGFTPISFKQLVNFAEGTGELPEKPVIITFDDGYYSNYYYALPISNELQIPITVFMTCRTVRDESIPPTTEQMIKMSADELREMQASPYVEIQSHTFGLHGKNTNYSEIERNNALPLDGESESDFKSIFNEDCSKAEQTLNNIGSFDMLAFSYPQGKSCAWAEQVLTERGYKVSVTTNYSADNIVIKGDASSLRLLGRMNVNDPTTKESLLNYLSR